MKSGSLSFRLILILVLAALALSLVPILLTGRYALPAADDFNYSFRARHLVESGAGFPGAVRGAVETVRAFYGTWQGTFSAIFLMALQPSVFGEGWYTLTPVIMLGALLAGTFVLCLVLSRRVFGLSGSTGGIAAALALFLGIQLLPSPVQGLFWYNGSIYYIFFHSLALLALALGVRLVKDGGLWRCVLLCLLALILGGGNYVTALCCSILVLSGILLLAFLKNPGWKRLILPALLLLIAFAVSMAAPGNAVRQTQTQHQPQAVQAVLQSFAAGGRFAVKWMSLPLAGSLLFLAPIFWFALRESRFAFPCPWLVTLYSYCLFSAMFCPTLYALGSYGDLRLLNILYLTYVLLLILNLLWWLGWLSSRKAREGESRPPLRILAPAALVLVLCLGAHLALGSYTGTMCLGALRSGEARAYAACGRQRLEQLHDPAVRNAVLEPFPSQPYVLFLSDVTPNPEDWRNVAVAEYYNKESVVLGSAEAEGERSAS